LILPTAEGRAMYLPDHFKETSLSVLHAIIREHPLGILVTQTGGLDANHLPFELDASRGSSGTLVAHVARANSVSHTVPSGSDVMVIFRGAQSYISPSWYPSKHAHHKQVPSWNYEVVHAHGKLKILDDEKYVRGVVARLTRRHEASEPKPWKMGDAPPDYLDKMVSMIVGIEIEIERIEGKRKLSQNKDAADRQGAAEALGSRGAADLAAAMRGTIVP
jgi:transcriptional regulator